MWTPRWAVAPNRLWSVPSNGQLRRYPYIAPGPRPAPPANHTLRRRIIRRHRVYSLIVNGRARLPSSRFLEALPPPGEGLGEGKCKHMSGTTGIGGTER